MTIIEITRPAKCKDCAFITPTYIGKRKIHRCSNPKSKYYQVQITLKDKVCEEWKL